ncbi:MAG: hypothetical protein KC620_20840 [Myxococcales bacterium]|nr:hypothetical protein [Myxococcales bacterium]
MIRFFARTAMACAALPLVGCPDVDRFAREPDMAPVVDQSVAPPMDAQVFDRAVAPDAAPADAAPDAADAAGDVAMTDDAGPDLALVDAAPDGPPAPASCLVDFVVALPADTPAEAVHVAGTFTGQAALDWNPADPALAMTREGDTARISVELPHLYSLEYKYARGDWERVEVTANCAERNNRGASIDCLAGEHFQIADAIDAWRDLCE